eukprot:15279121-Ditylum_brightwellii.AAC.1
MAEYLEKRNDPRWAMSAKAEMPMRASYRPESDITPVLSPLDSAYCQSLIGMLRQMVELGRIDICLDVSVISSHLDMPREGHMAEGGKEIPSNMPETKGHRICHESKS